MQKHGFVPASPSRHRSKLQLLLYLEFFGFRVYTHDPPLHTELGATDRCCVTFGIAESEVQTVTDFLVSIYACLSQEVASSTQQDLQRVIPLFWNVRPSDAPTFYRFRTVTFLDIRSCTQEEKMATSEHLD